MSKKQKNNKTKKPLFYRFIVFVVKTFYKKRTFVGTENMPSEPSIYISNHAQMHGPIANQLFFPTEKRIWCIGEMMNIKEVPAYAYKDFWSHKPKYIRWFYKILSYIIAPISSHIFNNADTIGVYKDSRLITTFRNTIKHLKENKNIVIFPEKPEKYNEIVNEFQDKFIDVAKLYYDRYKIAINFVPMYNAAKLKQLVVGKPIKYDPNLDVETQRKVICDYLKQEITNLAKELPVHTVVPYNNVKKKHYPKSK